MLLATEPVDYEAAAAVYRASRRGGDTVCRLIDCLIAATAIRADVAVLHAGNDFDGLARHSPLRIDPLWRPGHAPRSGCPPPSGTAGPRPTSPDAQPVKVATELIGFDRAVPPRDPLNPSGLPEKSNTPPSSATIR